MEQVCTSKNKREICHYIQTKGRNASFFLQIIFLLHQGGADRGIRDMDWRAREGLPSVPTHESTLCAHQGWEHMTPFSAQHSCLLQLWVQLFPSNYKEEINTLNILAKKPHLWFQITNVKPV